MHSGEEIPVELFRRHRMEWDGLDRAALAIGHHAPDDLLRALDQTANGLIGQMLGDGLVFRGRGSAPQGMTENRGFGRQGQGILTGPRLALRPLGDAPAT